MINTTAACIMATRPSAEPVNLLQQILRDADMYNLGTKEFGMNNRLVYEEVRLRNGAISKTEWNKKTIELMERHQFYTSYCKELLTERKMKNLKKLKAAKAKQPAEVAEKQNKGLVKERNALTTKGIQTMLRLTSENHMRLSDMADGKANTHAGQRA